MSGRAGSLLVVAVGVALATSCGAMPTAAPTTVTVTPTPTSPATPPARAGSRPCTVQLALGDGQVSVQTTGGGGSTQTTNDDTFYSCGGGPRMQVELGSDALTLTVDGSPVSIPAGQTQQVGGYRVTVMSANDTSAQFTVYPPGG